MEKSLNNCSIKFHNREDGIYFAGETVSGTVQLYLRKPQRYEAVTLRLSGTATAHWNETQNKRSTLFKGEQEFFKTYIYLVGDQAINELDAGVHKFDFEFKLPSNLPSSLETTNGDIKYEAKVTATKSMCNSSCFRTTISVIANIDLNSIPDMRKPIKMRRSIPLYFLFSKKGKLHMNVEVPCSGFVSGQDVHIKCHVKNESSVNVNETKFSIIKKITYTSETPYKTEKHWKEKVVSVIDDGVDKYEEKQMTAILKIPPQPASTLSLCKVITIEYVLKVKAVVSGTYPNLILKTPITLGTIALQPNVDEYNSSTNSELPSTPYTSTMPGPSAPSEYHSSDLPTYEEVMNEDKVKRNFQTPTKD